jgi:hypothetical protein
LRAPAAHLDHKIGTLSPGKEADLITLATDRINVFPLNNVPGTIVTLMAEFVARAAVRSLNDADTRGSLSQIKMPTLVIVGEQDRLAPPQESEILAKGISDSTLSLIPGAGHFSMLENPAAFNRILRRFLDGLPRGRKGADTMQFALAPDHVGTHRECICDFVRVSQEIGEPEINISVYHYLPSVSLNCS